MPGTYSEGNSPETNIITIAKTPNSVDKLLYEFAKLEAVTAFEDEKAYSQWLADREHSSSTVSFPPQISPQQRPLRRYFSNDGTIEKKIANAIDKSYLSNAQKTILKGQITIMVNDTANEARKTGESVFHKRNPAYRKNSLGAPRGSIRRKASRCGLAQILC